MSKQQAERRRTRLIEEFSSIHPIILHNDSAAADIYQRQLVAFHVGLFHGLVALAKTDEDFAQVEAQLSTIKTLLPYYDRRTAAPA